MNKRRKRALLYVCCTFIAILLIVVGSSALVFSLRHYSEVVTANQDSYLLNSVRYVDRNLSIQLDTYRSELKYVLNRPFFIHTENEWRKTGAQEDLLGQMSNNLLAEDQYIHGLLAVRNGKIVLSTSGHTDYTLAADYAISPVSTVTDGSGALYLSLPYNRSDVTFLALVDLAKYYGLMQQALPVSTDRLFLLESKYGHFIHQSGDTVMTTHMEKVSEDHQDRAVFDALWESEAHREPSTASYFYTDSDGKPVENRLAVIPKASLSNGPLTIGMSVNFTTITAPLYDSMRTVLYHAGLLMIGVAILGILAIAISMSNVRRNRELEELKQKNAEMATLTERTLSLYHHQRLETIGTLTSSIAHEFGNLLTPIMGYSIMTLEALPPECEDLADNLREIYEASCNAKTIISRLNDLSRKNTGASYRYLAPDDLIRRTLSVAQPSVPENVTVKLDLQSKDAYLHGNETQLSQMLLNLLLNACHAMRDQGGTLGISTRTDGKLLHIRVSDTGTGILPENMEKIFDPFFTTREAGKGTGLGLPVSLQVAREHGGDISVTSKRGEGSVFEVVLPVTEPALQNN